jgi:hypothetical protein
MINELVFCILLVITIDMVVFFYHSKRYKKYLNFSHYIMALKIPIYQKILILEILFVYFITVFF